MSRQMQEKIRPPTISGRRLAKNTIWNLLGLGLPTLIAIITIPMLIGALGESRFGVLSLAWMVIGYFSLFDMGLGRAMTQMIAKAIGGDSSESVVALFWTGLTLMTLLGVVGGSVLALIAPFLVGSALKIPVHLQNETLWGLYLVSIGLPIVISMAGLRGVVEAYQRFNLVFWVKMLQGTVTFIGPLMAVLFTTHIAAAIAVLLAGRLISWLLYLVVCIRTIEHSLQSLRFKRSLIRPMVTYGGWMTISSVLAPVLVYTDRLLISGLVSMKALAYYTTPAEIVFKMLIVPEALLGVVFPVLAGTYEHEPQTTNRLFVRSMRYIYFTLMPAALIGIGFGPLLLRLWLGEDFAQESYRIMQWLLIGILFNGVAYIPIGLIGAVSRPDLSAKIHLLETPLYIVLLWVLVSKWGVEGAAIAFALRTSLDAGLLTITASHLVRSTSKQTTWMVMVGVATFLVLVLLVGMRLQPTVRLSVSMTILGVFALLTWFVFMQGCERRTVLHYLDPRNWRSREVKAV